jgi:hypothetical protein
MPLELVSVVRSRDLELDSFEKLLAAVIYSGLKGTVSIISGKQGEVEII